MDFRPERTPEGYLHRVRLCIGLCTRARTELLQRMLESLATMVVPVDVDVRLCVVENDTSPSHRPLVEGLAHRVDFTIDYLLETRPGIPFARNRLLQYALDQGCHAVLFVDDDEAVDPAWLESMVRFAQQQDWQAVIQGRVEAQMEAADRDYLLPFFTRTQRATGESLTLCASNNTLVPLAPVRRHRLTFDETRPHTGGEDTIFFSQLKALDVPLVYCREALVVESIPPERARVRWLAGRKFRVGLLMGSGDVAAKPRSAARSLWYALHSVTSLAGSALLALGLQRGAAIRLLLRACRSAGHSLGYLQIRTQPYRELPAAGEHVPATSPAVSRKRTTDGGA